MLIEFRVKNFHSIQDEQMFSMVASHESEHEITHVVPISNNLRLLKSSAIYGANAAGKTSFISAIKVVKEMVENSANYQRGISLPITPFLLGDSEGMESEFEIIILVDNTRYQYGFSATKQQITDEWLFVYQSGSSRAQKWFTRTLNKESKKYEWKFGSKFIGAKILWRDSTRENALFLSTAVKLNSEQLKPIFDWFFKLNISGSDGFKNGSEVTVSFMNKLSKREILIDFFKAADLDIDDVVVMENKNQFENFDIDEYIKFSHLRRDGKSVFFDFEQESDGTRKFFKFIGAFLHVLFGGGVLIVDEFHNHFHPLMSKFLVELFHNPSVNVSNAQLIFTTHETSILSRNVFRRDQIWFCEKQNKATQLYPLSDFKVRKETNLESAYLLGKFGALPYLKNVCDNMESE